MSVDVVARLQLRAEQFSSETGRAFSEMKTRAASTASEIRGAFTSSFAEVSKLAQSALTLPRTTTGSLDLSSEIAQLKASAVAAEQDAVAKRELSIAMSAAASASRSDAESLRLDADASAVASLASERNAQAIRARIVALEAVQVELSKVTSATDLHAAAGARVTVSAGQQRAAMQQLGFQIGDIAQGLTQKGVSAMTVFAQQSGQVVQALGMMTNSSKGFLGFLGGPWGAAISAGAIVVGTLASRLLETGNALNNEVEKLKESARATELDRVAKIAYSQSIEGLTQAINDARIANDKWMEGERSAAKLAADSALATLALAEAKRKEAVAKLEAVKADMAAIEFAKTDTSQDPAALAQTQSYYEGKAAALDAQIAKINGGFDALRTRVQEALADVADEAAKSAIDPLERIRHQYERKGGLIDQEKKRLVAAKATSDEMGRQLGIIRAQEAAAIKAEQARQSEAKKVAPTGSPSSSLLSIAERYRGTSENTPAGRATLKDLFAQANVNIDPKIVAWCAAFVNAVLATGGLKGTGSLSAKSFLDYGTKTNAPQKGDIVVSSRPGGGHVGFFEGFDKGGNVRVLGGNTGDKVGVQTVKRADVLGFRKAPSSAQDEADQAEKATRAAELFANAQQRAHDIILGISASWDEQPRLIDRARVEANKLDEIIANYRDNTDAASKAIVANAQAAKQAIADGLDRPFRDYMRAQRESVEIQTLVLKGRDAEAAALQDALRLQQQQGYVTKEQLADISRNADQQERISRALEDQRRIVNIYSQAVGDVQRGFDQFLGDIQTKGLSAFGGLAKSWLDTFKQTENNLLSNAIFGGLDRKVEDYVRRTTGQKTPADILRDDAGAAGGVIKATFGDVGNAATDLATTFKRLSGNLAAPSFGPAEADRVSGAAGLAQLADIPNLITDGLKGLYPANDNGTEAIDGSDIVVTANRDLAVHADILRDKFGVLGVMVDGVADNLDKFGVHLSKDMREKLKTVLEGASFGQLGGSIFSAIGGGKKNDLASGAGGALGEFAGKELGKVMAHSTSKLLGSLSGAAGPIGAVLGGVLGSLIPTLFSSPKWANASLSTTSTGQVAGTNAAGRGSAAVSAASAEAKSVASAVNSILDQLGATVKTLAPITLGTFDGKYRVDTLGRTGSMDSKHMPGVKDFGGDQQAAIQYAVAYELSHAVIEGISQASQRILAQEGDINSALSKVMLVESIPKDLKAMLDPVGGAIDDLNRKWKHTVDALDEGGASAEQYAQAQQLYKLQLDQVKASTASASSTLKDFRNSLNFGSASSYSFRDQEAAAKAALEPFLTTINAGGNVDQSKYQEAAKAFLDVERQLYGSTQAYFDALDSIQAATNKAISTIDNAVPITPGVQDPFTKYTAEAAAKTAQGVQTGNEIADTTNDLLSQNNELLSQMLSMMGSGYGDFIGADRLYGGKLAGNG